MAAYDPNVHRKIWHNKHRFELEQYRKSLKICRGCGTEFAAHDAPEFVVAHKETRCIWTKYGRNMPVIKAFYHCSLSCILPRHPYFNPRKVFVARSLRDQLTANVAELFPSSQLRFKR